MKLETDIKPRGDGTVIFEAHGVQHIFVHDANGHLVCDVADDAVAFLLDTGNCYPADEADMDAGIAAVQAAKKPAKKPGK
jgi:hypothetical protein